MVYKKNKKSKKIISLNKNSVMTLITISFIFILASFMRFYNLEKWLLANADEISLLNNLDLPLLKGGFASTTFFFYVIITKIFFFIKTFPTYRYISGLINLIGIFIAYKTALLITDQKRSFLLIFILSIHWYFVYISRLFEIGALTPFFTSLILYFYFKWKKTNKNIFLFLLFITGGLALGNHVPPMVYFLSSLYIWIIYLTFKRKINPSALIISFILFLVTVSPYIYVITFVNSLRKGITFFYPENKHDIHLANIYNPQIYLKTLTEILTLYQTKIDWYIFLIPATLFIIGTFIVFVLSKKNDDLKFLFFLTYFTLFLITFSIAPAYNEGHFSSFLTSFIFLILKLTETRRKLMKYFIFSIIVVFCLFNIFFIPKIFQNQYKHIEWLKEYIQENKIKKISISDGAYLSLKHTHFLDNVELNIFYCNPITEVDDETIIPNNLLIATFDCNVQEYFEKYDVKLKEIQRINTLMEANLAHGSVFYIITT